MSSEAEAREQRGQKCLDAARKARFDSTGEVRESPDLDDAAKERALTARSIGGEAVHSGAFDSVERVPAMIKAR
jgi:hypothetical protein